MRNSCSSKDKSKSQSRRGARLYALHVANTLTHSSSASCFKCLRIYNLQGISTHAIYECHFFVPLSYIKATCFVSFSHAECAIHGEIIFLIDGSTSASKYFEKMKSFFKELLDQMVYSNLQIGMAQFGDRYQEEFPLSDHQNKSVLKDKIDRVSIMKSNKTHVGNALKRVKTSFKSPKQRAVRDVTKQMLLVATDGISRDDVAGPAEDLRKEGVEIYTIGVGKVNQEKLQRISGSSDRKFIIDDNICLSSQIEKSLITALCKSDIKAGKFNTSI